jgi:hypothetical protein
MKLTSYLHLVPGFRVSEAVSPVPPYVFIAYIRASFILLDIVSMV